MKGPNIVPCLFVAGTVLITALIFLACSIKDPIDRDISAKIDHLIEDHPSINNRTELMEELPSVVEAMEVAEQIRLLKSRIDRCYRNPAIVHSRAVEVELRRCNEQVVLLKKELTLILDRLSTDIAGKDETNQKVK